MDFFSQISGFGALAACLCCLVVGCETGVDSKDHPESGENAEAQQPPEVVALVNGREITYDELERHLDRLGELHRRSARTFDENTREDKRRRVVHRLIDRELLRDYASQQNIDVDDEQVDDKMHRRIDREFADQGAFRRYLDANDETVADFRRRLHDELTLQRLLEQRVDREQIDEQQLRDHYDRIANRRPADDRIEASRLSIQFYDANDEHHRQFGQRIDQWIDESHHADAQLQQLDEDVDDWAGELDVAVHTRLHSPQWYERRRLCSQTAASLFDQLDSASDDQLQSVATTTGWEVYQIYERRDEGIRQFDEVEDLLRDRAYRNELRREREQLLEQLREGATIVLYLDDVSSPSPADE